MKKKIVIIGTGGHAKSLANVINDIKKFQIIGYVGKNKKRKPGLKIKSYLY